MEVRRITYNETKPFIMGIHYARRMPCIQYAFVLFDNGLLIGVCTFGQPASYTLCKGLAGEENRKNVLELNRLCFLPDRNDKNNASFLVSHSLKMLPRFTFVVSYADTNWSHVGYVYQATNFLYTGCTKSRTDKYSESGHSRHYKDGETRRQFRSSKHRYVFLVGTKNDKRTMLKMLKYKVENYPKGTSSHYDVNNPTPLVGV